ncbi:MAG: hypothetical protein U0K19_01575 [Bifidobacteriaceae bacterium]|nr:hypothetical protein [Bifidobacteriaceae bacterium]
MKLIDKADIVVKNFRPAIIPKSGIASNGLIRKLLRLIVCFVFRLWPVRLDVAKGRVQHHRAVPVYPHLHDRFYQVPKVGAPIRVGTFVADTVGQYP